MDYLTFEETNILAKRDLTWIEAKSIAEGQDSKPPIARRSWPPHQWLQFTEEHTVTANDFWSVFWRWPALGKRVTISDMYCLYTPDRVIPNYVFTKEDQEATDWCVYLVNEPDWIFDPFIG